MTKDKKKISHNNKKYRVENSEKIRLKKIKYRIENKEKISEYNKKYKKENKIKIKTINEKSRIKNISKIKETQKEYKLKNKEKYKLYNYIWFKKQKNNHLFIEQKKEYDRYYYYNVVRVRNNLNKINDIMLCKKETWCSKKLNNINHPWKSCGKKMKFEWENY